MAQITTAKQIQHHMCPVEAWTYRRNIPHLFWYSSPMLHSSYCLHVVAISGRDIILLWCGCTGSSLEIKTETDGDDAADH